MYCQLDPQAAKEAANLSNRITEKGQYTGTFIRAQHITTKKGIEGIDFDFVTDDEKRARFFLYTRRENGETVYGYKQLMTILAAVCATATRPLKMAIPCLAPIKRQQ